jgi:hypothetical protein
MTVSRIPRPLRALLRRRPRNDAFEQASSLVEAAAFAGFFADTGATLAAELDRARRYQRALSVAVLTTRSGSPPVTWNGSALNGSTAPQPTLPALGNGQPARTEGRPAHSATVLVETRIPQVVSLLAGSILNDALRESDTVWYEAAKNRFVIGLVESDREQSRGALCRIAALMRSRLGVEVRAGTGCFPEDGLTLDDLITSAEDAWLRAPEVFEPQTRLSIELSDRPASAARDSEATTRA